MPRTMPPLVKRGTKAIILGFDRTTLAVAIGEQALPEWEWTAAGWRNERTSTWVEAARWRAMNRSARK